jgi:hypothetical protein
LRTIGLLFGIPFKILKMIRLFGYGKKVELQLVLDSFNMTLKFHESIIMKMLRTFLFCTVVLCIATGMGITLIQTVYSWSTHMTFHNLADNASELSIVAASSCTAQVNSNCEAGAEYVWYNIDVYTPPKDQQTPKCTVNPIIGPDCVYPHLIQKAGVYGHCDVYVKGSDGNYDVTHHCTAADAAGLKPPQNMTNMTAGTNRTEVCLSCGGSNITSSNSSSSSKMNLEEGIKALQSGD